MAHRNHIHTRSRAIGLALLVALAIAALFVVLPGCESTPAEPEPTNPFDPDGPYGGDPLRLSATLFVNEPNTIFLIWIAQPEFDMDRYEISISDNPDSNWDFLAEVPADTTTTYHYRDYDGSTTHWFRVRAFLKSGEASLSAYATPQAVPVGPWSRVGPVHGKTATRYPLVRAAVTRGDSLRVALDPTFTDSLRMMAAPAPGDTAEFIYDLGPATANDDSFTVFLQSWSDDFLSEVAAIPSVVQFRPNFQVDAPERTLARRLVDLIVPDEGVVRMRFANSQDGLTDAAWVPGAPDYPGFLLQDTVDRQSIWGEFEGDFGFTINPIQLTVTPDKLTGATFKLKLTSDRVTDDIVVTALSTAVATHMRISESPNFSAVPWVAYEDSTGFTLSPGEGRKNIYAQFRNDWVESAIYSDYAIYVSQPADVAIVAPQNGDILFGGTSLLVQGISSSGSGTAPVDEVKFDAGDGEGFRAVGGTDEWSYMWDVPLFTADTPLTLRARAWVGEDSVTTTVAVTVTQLVVLVDEPLDGALLASESDVAITGTAKGILAGATLDSVVVDIGGDVEPVHLEADGDATWSATWTTPAVADTTDASITARVWAGGESAIRQVNVRVVPGAAGQ